MDDHVTQPSDDALAKAYLLGALAAGEAEQVEERLLKDGEFFEQLVAAEFALADAYVREELSRGDRELFDARLAASPALQERVDTAHALAEAVARRRTPKTQTWRAAIEWLGLSPEGWRWLVPLSAMATLLVVATLSTLRTPGPAVTPSASTAPFAVPPESVRSPRPSASSPVLALALGVTRSTAATPVLEVTPGVDTVQIDIALDGPASSPLKVTLLTSPQGEEIWSQARLRALSRDGAVVVSARVPVEILEPGDYEVLVSEVPAAGSPMPLGSTFFRVSAR